ncbi:MAG: serpin family protein [Actinomycetaceae bacterium]|nr:serpin family protein [Actinomycetaceae bacterium]
MTRAAKTRRHTSAQQLRPRLAALGICLALGLVGCSNTAAPGEKPEETSQTQAADPADNPALPGVNEKQRVQVVIAANQLAADVLKRADKNLVASPASLQMSLAALSLGAELESHQVKSNFKDSLGMIDGAVLAAMGKSLKVWDGDVSSLSPTTLPEKPILHMVDQVVVDDDAQVKDEFLTKVKDTMGADVLTTDLASLEGLKPVNDWVKEHSGGILDGAPLEPDENNMVIIQNLATFGAQWKEHFKVDYTKPDTFHLASGEGVEVQMMNEFYPMPSAQYEGWVLAEKPYTEGFVAQFILPPKETGFADLHADVLTYLDLQARAAAAAFEARDAQDTYSEEFPRHEADSLPYVNLSVPRTTLQTRAYLRESIAGKDLEGPYGSLFLPGIFPGITDNPAFAISDIIQDSMLNISEAGTLATTLTSIPGGMGAPPSIEVKLDRPFIVLIRDATTRWPVYAAKVMDPRG